MERLLFLQPTDRRAEFICKRGPEQEMSVTRGYI